MTSDAKIGLLLGLVFIFVIAFVINGLPSLRPPISKVDATTTMPLTDEDFTGGVAGKTEKVVDWSELLDQQRTGGETAQAVVEAPKSVVQAQPAQPAPQTANGEGVRSILPLPGIERLLDQLTPTVQKDQLTTINVDTPGRAAEQPAASGRQPVAVAPQPRPELKPEPKPVEAPVKVDTREPPRSAAAASTLPNLPGGKIYVVVDGDNLSSVAKKAYGPEEGNRRVNIDRIIQVNQGTLKSPNDLAIGQKLIIPPLPKPAATAALPPRPVPNGNRPADVLPKTLFERPKTLSEKVESLGRRASAAMPAPTPEGRWYTVQDGDNLWKIAAGQLGGGSRWDEIHKLNAEILTSQDSLKVGMRLRLPPK